MYARLQNSPQPKEVNAVLARLVDDPHLGLLPGNHAVVHWREQPIAFRASARIFILLYENLGTEMPAERIASVGRISRASVPVLCCRLRCRLRWYQMPFALSFGTRNGYTMWRR